MRNKKAVSDVPTASIVTTTKRLFRFHLYYAVNQPFLQVQNQPIELILFYCFSPHMHTVIEPLMNPNYSKLLSIWPTIKADLKKMVVIRL
jgi:hypothetical protein